MSNQITHFHIVLEWQRGLSWCYTIHMMRGGCKRVYQNQPTDRVLALIRIAGRMLAETVQGWHGEKSSAWHFGADLPLRDKENL